MPAYRAFLKTPLAREIALILLLKMLLLMGIRLVWFTPVAGVTDDAMTVGRHLFGSPVAPLEKIPG